MASKKKEKIDLDELISISNLKKDEISLPKGWEWISLEHLVNYERGITFPAAAKKNIEEDGLIGCARTANIQSEFKWNDMIYIDKNYVKDSSKLIKDNDILMSISNSYHLVGKISFIPNTLKATTFGGFLMAIRAKSIESKYLFYYLRFLFNIGQIQKLSGQTTNIANLNSKKLNSIFVPVPNRNEQKMIVRKIEKLINKINEARQLIEEVKETFELRRASFLERVFKFEYHDLYQKDVNNIKTTEIFDFVTSGSRGWAKYYSDSGDIFIRVGNLKHDSISLQLDEIQYVCLPENTEGKRTEVQAGDILVSITADIGRIAVIEEGLQKAYINQHIALARPKKYFYSPYIGWYLASKTGGNQQMMELQRGATKVGLGLNDIKNIIIPVPTYEQQKEIAEFIKIKLKEFGKTEWFLESCFKQCNELKKSILQKAFKGELSTNNSNEEQAIDLLKSILQEKL